MSSANSPHWQMCRLRRETVEELRAWVRGHDRAYNRGQVKAGPNENGEYPIDLIINLLLEKANDHRDRSKRASRNRQANRRLRKLMESGANTPTDPPETEAIQGCSEKEGRQEPCRDDARP